MKPKKIKNYIVKGQQIGRGSFASVYKVEKENQPGNYFAAKLILKQKLKDKYMRQALKTQIKITQKIQSQHIIPLIQVIQTKKSVCLIQKLCEKTLQTKIEEQKSIKLQQSIKIMAQILDGYLHLVKNNIIHRDLKPENILISKNNYYISDFGFAKFIQQFQRNINKTKIGTPFYMSPQILKYQQYTYKCDIWSIGLIFYQMIHGYLPWDAQTQYQLLSKIKSQPIETLITIQEESVRQLLLNCLKYQQKDRYSWRQLYEHKFFNQLFRKKIFEVQSLQYRCRDIIKSLKQKIKKQKLNLLKLFKTYQLIDSKKLDKKNLCRLLLSIDDQISLTEIGYLYTKFDSDNSGDIDFNQLCSWLSDNQIQMNYKNLYTKNKSELSITQNKIKQLLQKLKLAIEKQTIDLYTVFKSLDKDDSDQLDKNQLKKLFQLLETNISLDQLDFAFSMFDIDGNGFISFQQFKKQICKIAGKPQIYDDNFRAKLKKMQQQADKLTTIKYEIISHQCPMVMVLSKNPFLSVK